VPGVRLRYPEVYELIAEFGFTAHLRSRGEEAKAIQREAGLRARRWVVERTHSWLNRFRRLLVRWRSGPTRISPCFTLPAGL
jgi:transposase